MAKRVNKDIFVGLFYCVMLICFLISGGSALIYQIVWTRQCMALLGSTAQAISTVLSIFFLGLGVGSVIGGWIGDRSKNPLRWYAVAELLIAVWVYVVLVILSGDMRIIEKMIFYLPDDKMVLFLFRMGVSVFWFLIPAICMGMTFPLLSVYERRGESLSTAHISILYLVNTAGAVAGAVIAGFMVIPWMGYRFASVLGMALNVGAGLLSFLLSFLHFAFPTSRKQLTSIGDMPWEGDEPDRSKRQCGGNYEWVLLLGVFVTGLTCLGLEVLWTRLLIMVFLGTNYAYTTVLVSVLAGIALGSLMVALLSSRLGFRLGTLGLLYGFTASFVILTIGLINKLPLLIERYNLEQSNSFFYGVLGKFVLGFLILLLPMMGFGIAFPYALSIVRRIGKTSPYFSVGLAYGMNTLGGIVGSILGGFLILPIWGCERGILILGFLLFLIGLLLIMLEPQYRVLKFSLALAIFGLMYYLRPTQILESINRMYLPSSHRMVYFAEGVEGTVAVSEPITRTREDERVLWINRVQATTAIERGVRMNRFQGVLPWMFNREPKKVLFMCFGSGITCGTLGIGGFDKIDAIEISAEVLEASRVFADKNFDVHLMGNVHILLDDARNFLLRSKKKYDFITMEPMPLALSGVSLFYTQEFYQHCLAHLSDGGMVSQWVPFHSTHMDIVRSAVNTFISVFPFAVGLFVNADLFLLGSNRDLYLDACGLERVLKINARLRMAMDEAGFPDVEEILSCFVMTREGLECLASSGAPITDEFPWVEYASPRYIYNRDSVPNILMELIPCVSSIDDVLVLSGCSLSKERIVTRHKSHLNDLQGLIHYYRGFWMGDESRRSFLGSLQIDPNNKQAQYYLRTIAMTQIKQFHRWGELEKVKEIIKEVTPYLSGDLVWSEFLESLHD